MHPASSRLIATGLALAACVAGCGEGPPSAAAPTTPGRPGPGLDARLQAAARVAELSTALALPDASGTPEALPLGEEGAVSRVESRLAGRLPSGAGYQLWSFRLREPGYVRVDLGGPGPDGGSGPEGGPGPGLVAALYAGLPGELPPLTAVDTGAGNQGMPRIETTLPEGRYTFAVAGPRSGEYLIAVESGGLPPGVLTRDTMFTARLDPPEDAAVAAVYPVLGERGRELTLTASSGELDPALHLLRGPSPMEGALVAADPGGAGDGSAGIRVILPETGRYTLVVSSARPGQSGEVRLELESAAPDLQLFDNAGSGRANYALLVGIEDYPGQAHDVDGVAVDVRMVRDILVDRFDFDPERIVLLTDDEATRENVANGIIQHLGQAGREGMAIFYFSGLGTTVPRDLGVTRPLDTSPGASGDRALVVRDAGGGAGLLLDDELGYLLSALRAGRKLAIVDASFGAASEPAPGAPFHFKHVTPRDLEASGPLSVPTRFLAVEPAVTHGLTGLATDSAALAGFSRALYDPGDALVWWASAPGSPAWSARAGAGPSVFTQALTLALAGALPEATLQEVHDAAVRDVERYLAQQELPLAPPVLRGNPTELSLGEFFRQR